MFSGMPITEKNFFWKECEKIGDGSFCECYSLKDITVEKENRRLMTQDGILYDTQRKILCFAFDTSKTVRIKKNLQLVL